MISRELHYCLKGGIYLHRKSEKERNVAWLVPGAHGTAMIKRCAFDVRTPEPIRPPSLRGLAGSERALI